MSLGRSVSAASMLGPTKVVRRVDRPRPLKLSAANRLSALELSSVEDVVVLMENVCRHLNARNYERQVINGLLNLCNTLKRSGPQIENLYKDQLDKLGVALRNACRDDELDLVSRVHVLEIIELRAMNWQPNENVTAFYKNKLSQLEYQHLDQIPPATPGGMDSPGMMSCQTAPVMLNPAAPDFSPFSTSGSGLNNAPMLGPGEVVGTSGRFSQPTKIPGKNYFKDEVVIRNADSGKVMGLKGRRVHMIEELTETIISFQRVVPGARERLVQITGPALENILQAKSLIEDTIRRNQSPLPREEIEEEVESLCAAQELSDSKRNTLVAEREVPFHDYKYTVNVGEDCIRVTGANLDLVRTAKLVLDEYFSLTGEGAAGQHQAQTPVQSQTPSADQGRQRPVFTLGPRSNPSPIQPSPKTAFSPVSDIQRSGSLTERSGSVTFGSGKRNSLFSKPAGVVSPALGKSSSKSFSKPEISYDRAELLNMSTSKQAKETPPSLLPQLEEITHIVRRSGAPHLDGTDHLSKGLTIFAVEHYIKPYNMESFED